MGTTVSKPQIRSHVQDSVILSDGLPPLSSPHPTGGGDGRYIMVLGNRYGFEFSDAQSFQLDIIDLFLSKRTRIEWIGDFYDLAHLVGFYALDERRLVIVDYDNAQETLRQRLIIINHRTKSASCPFHRCYTMLFDTFIYAKTSLADDFAITMIPSLLDSPASGLVFPSDPQNPKQSKNVTELIDQANAFVRGAYRPQVEEGTPRVSTFHAPFFVSSDCLGFFIEPQNAEEFIDPTTVLVMNLSTGQFYLQDTTSPSSSFPLTKRGCKPSYSSWLQATKNEIAMVARYQRTGLCWQTVVAAAFLSIFGMVIRFAVFLMSFNCQRLSRLCLHASMKLLMWRTRLLEPRGEDFTKFGILNTRTLEWREVSYALWAQEDYKLIPFNDGRFAIASNTDEIGGNRMIGSCAPTMKSMEKYQLLANPIRMASLKTKAAVAVQRTIRHKRILTEIATRI